MASEITANTCRETWRGGKVRACVRACVCQRCHSLQSRNIGKNRDTLIFISVINQSIIPKTCISVVILVAEEPNLAVQILCMVQRGNKADIKDILTPKMI